MLHLGDYSDLNDSLNSELSGSIVQFELSISGIPSTVEVYNPNHKYDIVSVAIGMNTDAEVIAQVTTLQRNGNTKKIAINDLLHSDNDNEHRFNSILDGLSDLSNIIIITTAPFLEFRVPVIVSYFMINRTCAFYNRYPSNMYWLRHIDDAYTLRNINWGFKRSSIYVSPSRSHTDHRERLSNLLLSRYSDKGHVGAVFAGRVLKSQLDETDLVTGYVPIHNSYYNNTYMSIYTESVTDNYVMPSEKTFEPMLKGHWVLPFSSQNFISAMKTLGFEFPEFIDYSYEYEANIECRYQLYENEIHRLMGIPMHEYSLLWDKHQDILLHNRNELFKFRPLKNIDRLTS